MSLVLQSSGGGSVTLQEAVTASNLTITVPAITATMATLTTPSFATTIGVGGATAAASGAGITFPSTASASSDANTLDDYEEGTFTPTYVPSGGGTITYANQVGRYVKVGQFVFCTVEMSTNSVSALSGSMQIGGLPFTSQTVSYGGTISVGYVANFSNNAPTRGYVNSNATTAYLTLATSATSDVELPVANMRNGSNFNYFIGSICYRASA